MNGAMYEFKPKLPSFNTDDEAWLGSSLTMFKARSNKNHIKLFEWPLQSPDLYSVENLLSELKDSVFLCQTQYITAVEKLCIEEWPQMFAAVCKPGEELHNSKSWASVIDINAYITVDK